MSRLPANQMQVISQSLFCLSQVLRWQRQALLQSETIRNLDEFPPHSAFQTEEEKESGFFKLLSKSSIYESVANNEFQIKNDKNIAKIKGLKSRLI